MQCKKVQKEVKTVGEDVKVDVPHGPIESPQSHLQNILNEIFQSDFPNLQLNDLLKTNPVSFITNRESNVPEKCLTTSPQIITPRKTDCDTEGDKGRGFSFCAGSNESLYMNAEQTNGNDAEDSNTSWVTESCYSDPSPTPTLTELNAN